MKKHILILAGVIALSGTANAAELFGQQFYVSGTGSIGYATPSVLEGKSHPFMLKYEAAASGLWKAYSVFMVGASVGFQAFNQYSDTTASGGNYRSTRFFLGLPSIGVQLDKFLVVADMEWIGNLVMYKDNPLGSNSFASPLGFKLRALHQLPWLDGRLHGGISGEYLSLGSQKNAGVSTSLTTRQKMYSVGLAIEYGF